VISEWVTHILDAENVCELSNHIRLWGLSLSPWTFFVQPVGLPSNWQAETEADI